MATYRITDDGDGDGGSRLPVVACVAFPLLLLGAVHSLSPSPLLPCSRPPIFSFFFSFSSLVFPSFSFSPFFFFPLFNSFFTLFLYLRSACVTMNFPSSLIPHFTSLPTPLKLIRRRGGLIFFFFRFTTSIYFRAGQYELVSCFCFPSC